MVIVVVAGDCADPAHGGCEPANKKNKEKI